MVEDLDDPRRTEPSFLADGTPCWGSGFELHRATLQLKCDGVDSAGSAVRPVGTSKLSLTGSCGNGRGRTQVSLGPAGAAGPPLFYDRAVEGSELLSVDGTDLGQGFTRNGAQS